MCRVAAEKRGDVSGASSQFPRLDWASARGPRCSAACHACPSHAAALRSVTLGPSLKHWRCFVIFFLSCVTLISLLTVTWLKEEVALSNPEVRLTSASVIVHVSYPANQVKVASLWYALHLSSLLLYFYGLSAGTFWYGITLLTHNASATLY